MTQPKDTISYSDARDSVSPCMFKIGDHVRIRPEGLLCFRAIECKVIGIVGFGWSQYELRLTDGKRVYVRNETEATLVSRAGQ